MNELAHTHIPFRTLPPEAKFLFFLFAVGAVALHRDWPPTPNEIKDDLEKAWNNEKLTVADLDSNRIHMILEKYMAKYASDEGRWWLQPPQNNRKSCRRRNII